MFSRRAIATIATLSVAAGTSAFVYNKFNTSSIQKPVAVEQSARPVSTSTSSNVVFAEGQAAAAAAAAPVERERTYLMIKPDGVQRGLIGDIIARFEKRGYKLVGLKMVTPSKELLEEHYADLSGRSFFPGLIKYMSSGPVVCMVFEGKDVVKQARRMLGETNPLTSPAGSIRGDYSIEVGRNIMHGSDSVETAKHEIGLWFKPEELNAYSLVSEKWVYEN